MVVKNYASTTDILGRLVGTHSQNAGTPSCPESGLDGGWFPGQMRLQMALAA